MAKKKELEKKEEIGSAIVVPNKPQRGFEEGIEQKDLILPRATLIQALSPEMTNDELDVKVGQIIHSITKEKLPEEFIPIFKFKNYIKFNPRKKDDPNFIQGIEPGAIIWRTNDSNDPRVVKENVWGDDGQAPTVTEFMNSFSYFTGVAAPVVISFSKTSYKTGKQLLNLAKFTGEDMFSRKYRLSSVIESNQMGTYAVFKVSAAGKVDAETFKLCEHLWKEYSPKSKDIQVHEEGVEETDEPPF